MTRRKFKVEVLRLVTDRGAEVPSAARDIDLAESVLRRWKPARDPTLFGANQGAFDVPIRHPGSFRLLHIKLHILQAGKTSTHCNTYIF